MISGSGAPRPPALGHDGVEYARVAGRVLLPAASKDLVGHSFCGMTYSLRWALLPCSRMRG